MWFTLPHRSFSQLLSYLIGGGVVRLPYSFSGAFRFRVQR